MLMRWIAALAAFVIVILIGVVSIGNFGTGIDAGNSTNAGNRAIRRGAGGTLMCFSTVAVGLPI